MTIILHVYIRIAEGKREEFLSYFRPLEAHVKANEPTCLAYLPSFGKDPLDFYVFEEYVDEQAWKELHHASEPAKALFEPETFKRLTQSLEVRVSEPFGLGFQQR